jgi:hypothetical protein
MPSGNISGLPTRAQLGVVFKDPRTLLSVEAALKAGSTSTDAISIALTEPNFVALFGGVADGVTSNDVAFGAAEASSYSWIWLPDGEFFTTLARSAFTKHYLGPGKIVISGVATLPGRNTYIAEKPDLWPTQGATGFFRGDLTATDARWTAIGLDTREYIDARYFEAPFIPEPVWHEVYSGASGKLTQSSGALAAGATSAALVSVEGVQTGQTLLVTPDGMAGATTDTITVTAIAGTTITFTPALTTTYPGVATFTNALRTWGGVRYTKVTNYQYGAGDVYGDIARMTQGYKPKGGQTHVFETSTVGQYGGDVNFATGSSGTMATGWESMYADHGENVAVFAQIDTFTRDNDTSGQGQVWFGTYFKSEGSKPADVAHVIAGKWRAGMDTVRADLTDWATPGDNLNVAINTAMGHRWVMNSTADPAGRGGSAAWGAFYGNAIGDMFIESGNDGISDFIALRFNRSSPNNGRLRVRPTVVTTNVNFQSAGSISAGAELIAGGAVPRVYLGNTGVWIEWDGTHMRASIDNGVTFTNLV